MFRYARHTRDLKKMEVFYTTIVGLQVLGGFQNHGMYDGLFLGVPNENWHLEFTVSDQIPVKGFDADDCLVFYLHSEIEMNILKKQLHKHTVQMEIPRNPYWKKNGLMISDPDGFNIVFAFQNRQLTAGDALTQLVINEGIQHWNDLLTFVQQLPYGRNENRKELSLIVKERKGTCSSKHALIKKLADLNKLTGVKLIMGIYKMNQVNTPKIGNILLEHGLQYIPEAHCYLMLNNNRVDLTAADSDIDNLVPDILEEVEIQPEDVNEFKVAYHRQFLKLWIEREQVQMDIDRIWEVREKCIASLGAQ
jgi:hypothetical protein